MELERERGGEVCTPMSRWNSSLGSSSSSSISVSGLCTGDWWVSGMIDTAASSFAISLDRFCDAVEASERRDVVREASMGVTRYVDVP